MQFYLTKVQKLGSSRCVPGWIYHTTSKQVVGLHLQLLLIPLHMVQQTSSILSFIKEKYHLQLKIQLIGKNLFMRDGEEKLLR